MQLRPLFYTVVILLAFTSKNSLAAQTDAPDLTLKTDQGTLSLKDLKGQVVYVDFWASWCVPCRKSFPWMNQMQAQYGNKGFKVIAISVDDNPELAKKFTLKYPAHFTIAYDPTGSAAEQFKVLGMPHSFLIDRQGRIHSSHIGFKEEDKASMEAAIKQLVNQ